MEVKIVDLQGWMGGNEDRSEGHEKDADGLRKREEIVKIWDETLETTGFAVVVNHGIEDQVFEDMFVASRNFFLDSTHEQKMKYNYGPYGNAKGGFTPMGVEAVGRTLQQGGKPEEKAPPDFVENYVLQGDEERWAQADHPQELLRCAKAYRLRMLHLLDHIHRISALALGLEEDYFEAFYNPVQSSLRFAHYPPLPEKIEHNQIRYGAHHDYIGFTILACEDCAFQGLQVFVDGKWQDVPNVKGGLIVNVGEMLSIWTNGRWPSTLHRVVNPPEGTPEAKSHRFSIPFFSGPRSDALIQPLGTTPAERKPLTSGEYVKMKLGLSNT